MQDCRMSLSHVCVNDWQRVKYFFIVSCRLCLCNSLSLPVFSSFSPIFFLCFPVPPKILWISPNQTAELGNDVTLACTAIGRPTPRAVWKKNGRILLDSQSTGNITIFNITQADGGSYECSVFNIVANDTRTTVLNIVGW